MKNLKQIFLALALLAGMTMFAQHNAKVIVVVNKADWCSICRANAQRAVTTFAENNKDGYFQFIVNDITNAETKKASQAQLKSAGVDKAMENYFAAGVMNFFDAKTKKPIAQVTVANSDEEIAATMNGARK